MTRQRDSLASNYMLFTFTFSFYCCFLFFFFCSFPFWPPAQMYYTWSFISCTLTFLFVQTFSFKVQIGGLLFSLFPFFSAEKWLQMDLCSSHVAMAASFHQFCHIFMRKSSLFFSDNPPKGSQITVNTTLHTWHPMFCRSYGSVAILFRHSECDVFIKMMYQEQLLASFKCLQGALFN